MCAGSACQAQLNFLNLFWQEEKESHVLYLSKVEHLPRLTQLYPRIIFHCYNKTTQLEDENIVFHPEEFNIDTVRGWRNSAQVIPLYLISDEYDEELYLLLYPFLRCALLGFSQAKEGEEYLEGTLIVEEDIVYLVPKGKRKKRFRRG